MLRTLSSISRQVIFGFIALSRKLAKLAGVTLAIASFFPPGANPNP